ncbi:DNA polymerase III, subunit delta [uncultured Sporomusa sp.]|uniref:DNA polymerase III, subunit delta n=1 Tax=uncultured Sporomusa sp. TaxID=307249 RepID=A0A212LWW4_9FIRM|nr:DNA polymerase III subunit delta' [uncultured Sporomusa sp.]SCM82085.1 DNA polymerase III, subunit delta [uncultured Sporomusa sp.]
MVMHWDAVIGHQDAVQVLKAMLVSGAIPHALLFTGPSGIGKGLTARIMAAGILCNAGGIKPCGHCSSCVLYGREAHPDFTLVAPEGATIKIDQIRALQHFASLAPAVSPGRLCLIEDAEFMTVQAANSLLKLLEEPPAGFVFILVAGTAKPLLPTILSRCRNLKFYPLPAALLEQALVHQGYSLEAAAVAARLSGGRMGKALTLLAPDGLAQRDIAAGLFASLESRNMMAVWEQTAKLDSLETKAIITVLEYFLYLLRDVLLVAGGHNARLLYNIDLRSQLDGWAAAWPEGRCVAAMTTVKNTIRAIGSNANTRLALEELLIKLKDLPEKGENHVDSSWGPL